jgi:hypothetical protein
MYPDSKQTNQDPLVSPVRKPELTTSTNAGARALRTFEDDIADVVRDGKGSVLGIALAEQKRKDGAVEYVTEKKSSSLYLGLGILLLVAALGIVGYILYDKYGGSILPDTIRGSAAFTHPSIRSDKVIPVALGTLLPRNGITESLVYKLGGSELSTGAVTLAVPTIADAAGTQQMAETPEIFKYLAPNAPSLLARSLATSTVLGVYSGDTAETFAVLKVSSYEGAFSGMLGWEDFMSDDLYTLFGVSLPSTTLTVPVTAAPVPTNTDVFGLGNTIGSSTASTTVATTTKRIITTVPVVPKVVTPARDITKFVDRTIKNKDMRTIEDSTGKIYFLYGFANPSTIIITTSPESFFEVQSRLR